METRSPALSLTEELKPSTQAYGVDKSAFTSVETSTAMVDFPAARANLSIHTAPPTSTTFMKKKKKKKMMMVPKVPRNGCRRHVYPSRRLERFCKHRNGLFKKARELSNFCDAEVAAIVVSPFGTVSEFASSSMNHILKRYQSLQPQMSSSSVLLHDVKRWNCESHLLDSKLKTLQELKMFFQSESSSINVVQNVESILVQILDKIYIKKMELLEVEIKKMAQQGEILIKENIALEEKITQIMSTKECISKVLSGSEEFCYE